MSSHFSNQDNSNLRPPTIAERSFAEAREQLQGLSAGEVFDFIYRNNVWSSPESPSGVGSQLDATARLRLELPLLLQTLGVSNLLDIPCGDFSWLSTLQLPVQSYIGADIVPAVVARNAERFGNSHPFAEFRVLDLAKDPLPSGDALLCRDCLVHLPYSLIEDVFQNICRSQIRYVILTTFTGDRVNKDIEIGNWRPLNFEYPPFSFPHPEFEFLEGCTEEDGAYADKALGVWSVEVLRTQFSKKAG